MVASPTSSSDTDDEEVERLRSVAVDSNAVAGAAATFSCKTYKSPTFTEDKAAASSLKFYQARARDFLYEYLDKTFDITHVKHEERQPPKAQSSEDVEDAGFRLFKRAPSGHSDKRHLQEAPKRKLQVCNLDESSEMHLGKIRAAAIDGTTVMLHAEKAKAKALVAWALHHAKEKEEKRKEEERIALLKVQRGEKWLPSVAKDMQIVSPSTVSKLCTPGERPRDLRQKTLKQKSKKKISKAETLVVN